MKHEFITLMKNNLSKENYQSDWIEYEINLFGQIDIHQSDKNEI